MTVKEIAERAGVSIGTVDRVLHDRGRVSARTKDVIERIIRQSGFVPNPIARRLKRNKPYRLCALLPRGDADSGYWGQCRRGMQSGAEDLEPLGTEVRIFEYDRYDASSFGQAVALVEAAGADGILLAPIMPEESKAFVERLTVPYAFFDADLPGTKPLFYIGQDSLRGGYLAGRLAHLFAGPLVSQGPFAVLVAYQQDFHITQRRDGFMRYAEESAVSALVIEGVDMEHGAAATAVLEDLLRRAPDCQGVFVTSASAHWVAEAARKIRSLRPFIVIGYDLVPANHRLLAAGAMDAIISQRPETQGRQAVLDLYRSIAVGLPVAARIDIPLDLYIRENVPPPAADDSALPVFHPGGA